MTDSEGEGNETMKRLIITRISLHLDLATSHKLVVCQERLSSICEAAMGIMVMILMIMIFSSYNDNGDRRL